MRASPAERAARNSSASSSTRGAPATPRSSPSERRSSASTCVVVERAQLVHAAAREQRRVDLEVGVLGGRADQHHQPLLDRGQQRVLLRLVEAVDLVEEEDRALAARVAPVLGPLEHLAHLGAAGVDRRGLLEGGARVTASRRASVVLPVPGGPYRIIECGRPSSIAVRSVEPRPSRCSCPTNSPSDAGPHARGQGQVARRRASRPPGESSRSKSRSMRRC